MKSLFLRMFLWLCGTGTVLIMAVGVGYVLTNPDQLPFGWPQVGKGAIVSAARVAVDSWNRGGQTELTRYLNSLAQDTGLIGRLYNASGRGLSGNTSAPPDLSVYASGNLVLRQKGRSGGVRVYGIDGNPYIFLAQVPAREPGGFWYRTLMGSFFLMAALLCYLLARHVTAPVVQLRRLTSGFAAGDLTLRVTSERILSRKDEIGGLAGDFNRMATRIEGLVNAQRRMIADVSHELRSPLTRLGLAVGLLRRGGDPGASLARMEREMERLNTLISQLLTLSRLESLERPGPVEPIDIAALVRETAADADFEASVTNRSVVVAESTDCVVSGVRELMSSAVENVIRNASKYTEPGSQVRIRIVPEADCKGVVTIMVEDQGPGVPPEALEHIFEPFYRVDDTRDRRSGGAGLGLAIARHIVILHGGSIHAANRPEGGLEMRITLPVNS